MSASSNEKKTPYLVVGQAPHSRRFKAVAYFTKLGRSQPRAKAGRDVVNSGPAGQIRAQDVVPAILDRLSPVQSICRTDTRRERRSRILATTLRKRGGDELTAGIAQSDWPDRDDCLRKSVGPRADAGRNPAKSVSLSRDLARFSASCLQDGISFFRGRRYRDSWKLAFPTKRNP